MESGNFFAGYTIPLVSYLYEGQEQLNKDLVEILDELEDFYKSTKSDVNSSTNKDGNTHTKSILTHNFRNFNILDRVEYESVANFKNFVFDSYRHYIKTYMKTDFESLVVQCWGNKVGKFDYLSKHAHVDRISNNIEISGNYFIKSPGHDTYTRYYSPLTINQEEYAYIKNEEGTLSIFPSFVQHDTTANRSSSNYRYTLGIDVLDVPPQAHSSACFVELTQGR